MADVEPIDDDQPEVARGHLWPALAIFLVAVVGLGALFVLSSRTPSAVSVVERLVEVPDTPFTVVADPATPARPPFTITTVSGSAGSIALSLPGAIAGGKVLMALDAAGLDAMTAEVVRSTLTSVNDDGSLSPYITVGLVSDEGYSDIVGVSPDGNALWYSPAMVQVPADLTVGRTWTSEGLTLDFAPYTFTGTVVGPADVPEEVADYDGRPGCLDLRTVLDQQIPEAEGYTTERLTTWCPGLGAIFSENLSDGVVTRLGVPDEVEWPTLAEPAPPQSRAAGTHLPFPIPVTAIARPPMSVPGGLVVVNGSVQDLAALTVGAPPVDGSPDGSTLTWLQHPGGTVLGAAATGDRILVSTSLRRLQSFDHAGRMRWSRELPDVASGAPVPLGASVAVALVDGSLRGFDADTGEPTWTVRLSDVITESPVQAGDLIVAADTSGYVVAVDDAGTEQWSSSTETVDSLVGLPDGSVLVGQTTGDITLLEADGEERWTVSFPDSGVVSPGALWGDVIAVPTDGGLRGISSADGSVLWTLPDLQASKVNDIGLAVAGGRVVRVTPEGEVTPIAELTEADGSAPTQAFLARLGSEWVAVSQLGTITFLGVIDE